MSLPHTLARSLLATLSVPWQDQAGAHGHRGRQHQSFHPALGLCGQSCHQRLSAGARDDLFPGEAVVAELVGAADRPGCHLWPEHCNEHFPCFMLFMQTTQAQTLFPSFARASLSAKSAQTIPFDLRYSGFPWPFLFSSKHKSAWLNFRTCTHTIRSPLRK